MIFKKKSLVVALVSSFVIASVLVLTLIGYAFYIELKGGESRQAYQGLLQKINAKVYAKYIEIISLDAKIETSGVLQGKPVIGGVVKNTGNRDISGLLVRVKFLDKDGAAIYETVFHPQEPSLGSAGIAQIAIPYLHNPSKYILKQNQEMPFKKILAGCPSEIMGELKTGRGFAKNSSKWSGKLAFDILAIDFP